MRRVRAVKRDGSRGGSTTGKWQDGEGKRAKRRVDGDGEALEPGVARREEVATEGLVA